MRRRLQCAQVVRVGGSSDTATAPASCRRSPTCSATAPEACARTCSQGISFAARSSTGCGTARCRIRWPGRPRAGLPTISPARSLRTLFIIFMLSMMHSTSPATTLLPTRRKAARPASAPGRRCRTAARGIVSPAAWAGVSSLGSAAGEACANGAGAAVAGWEWTMRMRRSPSATSSSARPDSFSSAMSSLISARSTVRSFKLLRRGAWLPPARIRSRWRRSRRSRRGRCRKVRAPAKRLAGMDVGQVDFDERNVHGEQRVAQRDAGVGERRRIEDDEGDAVLPACCTASTSSCSALLWRTRRSCPAAAACRAAGRRWRRASGRRTSPAPRAEQIEVRAVQHQELRHGCPRLTWIGRIMARRHCLRLPATPRSAPAAGSTGPLRRSLGSGSARARNRRRGPAPAP